MTKRFLAQRRNRLLYVVTVFVAVSYGCNTATEESIGPGSAGGDAKTTTERRQERQVTQTRESDTEPRKSVGVAVGGEPPADSEAKLADGNEGQPSVTRMPGHDASQLVDALRGEDAVARFLAEEQLVDMGDAAIPALEPLSTAPGISAAREYAINILGEIGTNKAVEVLLGILDREQEPLVRAVVCRERRELAVRQTRRRSSIRFFAPSAIETRLEHVANRLLRRECGDPDPVRVAEGAGGVPRCSLCDTPSLLEFGHVLDPTCAGAASFPHT